MKKRKDKEKETENQPLPEKLLGKYRSVFNFNVIVYEFETHYKIYASTGTGDKFIGTAQKDDSDITY